MKICGLTSEADAGLLIKYGADYGGVVVFYPKSKRDVTIKEAKIIVDILKKSDIKAVALMSSIMFRQGQILCCHTCFLNPYSSPF